MPGPKSSRSELQLPDAEWDFDQLSQDEMRACLYFEYSRESVAVISDLTIWLKHFPSRTPLPTTFEVNEIATQHPIDRNALFRFERSPAVIALISPDFPTRPWQDIPQSERMVGLVAIGWARIEWNLLFHRKARRKEEKPLSKLALESFEIGSWAFTDEELVAQFREWLEKTRKTIKHGEAVPSPKGRTNTPIDLLRALGALRLRKFAKIRYGSYDANVEGKKPRTLLRGAKAAEDFLKSFYA